MTRLPDDPLVGRAPAVETSRIQLATAAVRLRTFCFGQPIHMGRHCVSGDAKVGCNFLVSQTAGEELEYVELSPSVVRHRAPHPHPSVKWFDVRRLTTLGISPPRRIVQMR